MARLDPIPRERMTEDQQRINDEIASTRSVDQAGGPFALWLRTPELADLANQFGTYLRHQTSVPQRLVELAVLTIARHWTAQYEWFVHARYIEKVVYALTTELHDQRTVSEGTYARAVELLGEQTVLELVTIIGFYTMVAMVLTTYRVDIPDGGALPLPVNA